MTGLTPGFVVAAIAALCVDGAFWLTADDSMVAGWGRFGALLAGSALVGHGVNWLLRERAA